MSLTDFLMYYVIGTIIGGIILSIVGINIIIKLGRDIKKLEKERKDRWGR